MEKLFLLKFSKQKNYFNLLLILIEEAEYTKKKIKLKKG